MMQASLERPRFRQDLVAELINEQGSRFIDVMCPDSGNAFRFFEVEYSLACAMDGERDVAAIVKWAQEELGLTPTPREVMTVIATLGDLGFVESGRADTVVDPNLARAASAIAAGRGSADELAKGVVVGDDTRVDVVPAHVELGKPGAAAAAATTTPAAMPKAPDLALGASGASAAKQPTKAPVEDVALGAPGARGGQPQRAPSGSGIPQKDLSVDLADHVAVKPDDVKDAVRQSRVVAAVDVPKELLDTVDPVIEPPTAVRSPAPMPVKKEPSKPAERPSKPAEPARPVAATPSSPAPVVAPTPTPTPVAAAPAPAAATPAPAPVPAPTPAAAATEARTPERPAVELPKQPAAAAREPARPVEQAPAKAKINPILVVVLILVIVAIAVFVAMKFMTGDKEPAADQSQGSAAVTPPAPKVITATIAMDTAAPLDVMAPVGEIDTIESEGKEVKTGDVVAMLKGRAPIDAELAKLAKEEEKLKADVAKAEKQRDDAQAANNAGGVTAAEAKVAEHKKNLEAKQTAITNKKAELDKLAVKAVTDGKLVIIGKPGQKLTAETAIARIERPTMPVATFQVPPGTKIAPAGTLSLTIGKTDKVVVCTVSDAQAETIKVSCPPDAGLAADDEVSFQVPGEAAVPPAPAPGTPPADPAAAPAPAGTAPN
ncbi:MAG: hypothetical protein AB7P03_04435 [Kofleriaceae bacterium]